MSFSPGPVSDRKRTIEQSSTKNGIWSRQRFPLLLAAVLLGAAFFRFFGTNFDQSHNQHPDERFIVGRTIALQWPSDPNSLLDVRNSPMNLRAVGMEQGCPPTGCGYPYGSLPVYLTRATGWLLDNILPATDTRPKGYFLQGYEGTTLLGRHLAALFDLITVLLVFLIGRRLYSRSAGLIAAALVAFAVTHIQLAHFYVSDTFLTTFMMGAVYFSVVLMQRPAWWAAAGAGICIGLAVASKVTIIPFALIVLSAVALRSYYKTRTRKLGAELGDPIGVRPAPQAERSRSGQSHFVRGLRYVVIAGVFAFVGFAVTEPYVIWSFDFSLWQAGGVEAVQNSNPWWTRLIQESDTQSGRSDLPFTRQYVGTTPLLYHLQQLVFWGLSPIPGLVVLSGFAVGIWYALRRRPAEILLLTGALPYFATILTLESKWMRYMLPLVPIFCLLGAALLVRGVSWERARQHTFLPAFHARRGLVWLSRNAFTLLTAITVGAAFLWSVAFANIYTQDHSREQASQWIYDNLPVGARRSGEVWDDSLPLGGPEGYGKVAPPGSPYFGPDVSFDLYPDRSARDTLNYLRDRMAEADYIILASNRLYGSMPHLPWRYPVQNRYYELLFAEKLGFVRVHTEHQMPELLGIQFDDQSADESFTVYDHPRVDIFKKVSTLTDDHLQTLFSTALNRPFGEYSMARHGEVSDTKSLAIDQPLASLPDVGDYSWNPLAQEETQWVGVFLWLVTVYVLGLAAMPIMFLATRNLPDRGYPFAKLLGLLLVSWATWILASGHVLPFTVWTVALMVLVLGGMGWLSWRMGVGDQTRDFWREKRTLVVFYELVFLGAFGAFLLIRLLNPDLWQPWLGGEKPMELGFLNATLRSPWMPPADPFFAGGYINYYYYGYFVVSCLIKLVGMDPHIAFNVAIPTLYALAFSGAASIGYNIVASSRRERGSTMPVSRAGMVFGSLTAVMMLAIGNLHGLYQLVRIYLPSTADSVVRGLAELGIAVPSFGNYASFNFWDPRSIIPFTINEFPFWTFLFADLHPHLIDLPFTLLALALSLNLAFTAWIQVNKSSGTTDRGSFWNRTIKATRSGLADLWGSGWNGITTFATFALVLGALVVTNSWDFPTYAAVAGLGVLISLLRLRRGSRDDAMEDEYGITPSNSSGKRLLSPIYLAAFASVGALAALALLAYVPFFLSFKAFYTEIIPIIDGGLIPGTSQQMRRTGLPDFMLFWSFFVFIALSYLVYRLWRFPWRNAFAGWRSLNPFGGSAKSLNKGGEPGLSTGQALFVRPTSALAPVASGQPGTFTLRGESPQPQSGALRSGVNALVDQEPSFKYGNQSADGSALRTVASKSSTTDEPTGESPATNDFGQGEPASRDLSWGNLSGLGEYKYDPEEGLYDKFYAIPEIPNWMAIGQSHAVAAPTARRTVDYSGVIPSLLGVGILAVTAALVVLQIVTGQYLLALLIALFGGIAGSTLAATRSAPSLLTGGLLCVALAVAMGVELVYLADHLSGGDSFRMNTVFKFYIQVWVLFAAGSGPAIYYLLYGLRDSMRERRGAKSERRAPEVAPAVVWPTDIAHEPVVLVPRDAVSIAEQNPRNWLVWSEVTEPLEVEDTPLSSNGGLSHNGIELAHNAAADKLASQDVSAKPILRAPNWTIGRLAWVAVFALFLASTLIYTVFGTQARVNDRFPVRPPVGSLNGINYMTVGTFTTDAAPLPINLRQDYAAIKWMNDNISGLHVLAELPMGYYREHGMRAASNTGFPMVVGGLHQGEQRAEIYDRLVADRGGDMNEFFTTTDIQRALLIISKYDIEFIYLGQLEHARTGPGLAKFEQMADSDVGILKAVFQTDEALGVPGTIIYQVVKEAETLVGAPVPNSGNPGIAITPVPTPTRTPVPTPPVDDPELNTLIAAVAANPTDREARMALVRWYDQNRFPAEAARELEIIVQQEPGNIAARHMLGDAYQAAGQPDKALEAWTQARDVDPNNPAGHNKLGIALNERQRYDDAIAAFQAAVRVDANFVEAWYHMGTAYEGKGDTGKAREAYQTAIDRSPEQNTWSNNARERLSKLK